MDIILNTLANIPLEELVGVHLSTANSNPIAFEAYQEAGLKYDDSWASGSHFPYFPHTLDYKSDVVKLENPVPGFWELPNIAWIDMDGNECSVSSGCAIR